MEQENLLPDTELFTLHLKQMEDSIFACRRAIEVLERQSEDNKEDRIVLITVVDMLKAHIAFKRQLMVEGKEWLDKELSKEKESD